MYLTPVKNYFSIVAVAKLLKRKKRTKAQIVKPDVTILPERPAPSSEKSAEFALKFAAKKAQAEKRLAEGLPSLWVEPSKTTAKQRKTDEREIKNGERKINAILSGGSRSPRGRKPDPVYDKADYRRRLATICRKTLSVAQLTRESLAFDKSTEESKVDKMKKALKRRKLR